MASPNLVDVYSASDSAEAYALASRLEEAGVRANVVGELLEQHRGALPFGMATSPRIWVPVDQLPRARDIVAAWESERQERAARQRGTPFQFGLSALLVNTVLLAALFALYRPLGWDRWLGIFQSAVMALVFGNIMVLLYRRKRAQSLPDEEDQ